MAGLPGSGGGGGNRTRVRKSSTKRSTYLVVSIWKSYFYRADQQAFKKPVTLNLASRQVTRRKTSQCEMMLPRVLRRTAHWRAAATAWH